MRPIQILIGGDLAPTPSNSLSFSKGDMEELVDKGLLDILREAEIKVFNLEVPLTDQQNPIFKDGPNLSASTSVIKGIQVLAPTGLNLANNHIMDQGKAGLIDTIELLKDSNIKYTGAGIDYDEASRPLVLESEGRRIGIYACAEHEFSIAGKDEPGANPLDLLGTFDHISALNSVCDYLIVLHHGGKEHYRYPSPDLQRVCRKMIKSGADIVVCQHSHCIGSSEQFEGGTIVYGQGNFLFDRHDNEFWNTSLLVKINLSDKPEIEYIPLMKEGNGVRLADNLEGDNILSEFQNRSEQIKNPGFVSSEFDKYSLQYGQYYLATLAGLGTNLRRADKVLNRPFTRLIYSRKKLDTIRNHFECETHRELIIRYIHLLTKKQ
jgi:poly-gamma-glutamate synthesis protein (capsule biosynthesis protein)